ncbi:MAG: 3-deoxy-D-manno-octulosonic acid transferase [Paludibacteraceae bacterium]|nr:3-deoxy-D-manno-octulosonic acid transferase [Paludibacteraceae bacterium]MBR5374558.1 3-deoxy-D-manno-octulosonic acid transferase [Paludibacteraceae bacterium]
MLYNLGMLIYHFGVWVASFWNEKASKFCKGRQGVLEFLAERIDKNSQYVWVHAASLGEFEQGRPIIEKLRQLKPEYKIVLTFFSPSGYEVRKNYEGADVVCYLPIDTSWSANKFLDTVNPSYAIFIKYEFWMNYIVGLKRRRIPTYIVSAIFRPNQVFFKWYGVWYRKVLHCFTHLFVQNQVSLDLLSSIGVKNVSLSGDTRFDRVADIAAKSKELPIVSSFAQGSKVIVAGSSWPKDEDILCDYFNNHPEVKMILAPHEIHQAHLDSIVSKLKRPYVFYKDTDEAAAAKADCLIINCFGLLSSIYKYGEVAYIGGGFGVGIHNTLEAAVYGMPVLFGPNYGRFQEAVDMVKRGGAFSIQSNGEYNELMDSLLAENSSLLKSASAQTADYVNENRGATERIVNEVFR